MAVAGFYRLVEEPSVEVSVLRSFFSPSMASLIYNYIGQNPSHIPLSTKNLPSFMKNIYRILIHWFDYYYLQFIPFFCLLLAILYLLFIMQQMNYRGVFEYVGIDFRLLYASGQIIREHGFSAVYDTGLQARYQLPLYENFSHYIDGLSLPFWPLPMPYLPFFVAPFTLLTCLSPLPSFVLWVILNAIFTTGYFTIWIKRLSDKPRTGLILAVTLLVSIANFLNTLFGQVNVILMIAMGETLFNLSSGRHLKAGLWLSIAWIKPQMLILVSLLAILRRKWHFLLGLATGSVVIGIVSLLEGGVEGVRGILNIILTWPTFYRTSGTSWLSAVDHLVMYGVPTPVATTIGILLVIIIVFAWIEMVTPRYQTNKGDEEWTIIFLATLLTQLIIMPHANVHMAISLAIPWLLFLCYSNSRLAWLIFLFWAIFSGFIFILSAQWSVGQAHNLLGMIMLFAHTSLLLVLYGYQKYQNNIYKNENYFL